MHVMGVDIASVGAAREAAAAVARVQRAAKGGLDASRFSTDVERVAMLVLLDSHDAAIACQAANRLGGKRGAVFDLALTRCALSQRLLLDMDNDLMTLAAVQRRASVLEEALRQHRDRIGATGDTARSIVRRVFGKLTCGLIHRRRSRGNVQGRVRGDFLHRRIERLDQQRSDLSRQPSLQYQRAVLVEQIADAASRPLPGFT